VSRERGEAGVERMPRDARCECDVVRNDDEMRTFAFDDVATLAEEVAHGEERGLEDLIARVLDDRPLDERRVVDVLQRDVLERPLLRAFDREFDDGGIALRERRSIGDVARS
jgi:hypothetical protein